MLDAGTLRVAFAVLSLTLFLLSSLVTYRNTRSSFSSWWCAALALFLAGSGAFLLDSTPQQWWANPLGNGLTVAGAASVWAASRSLRGRDVPLRFLVTPAVVMIVVSGFDSPATNEWSGGPLYLALMSALLGLSAREIRLLDSDFSRARVPLFVASGTMAVYYFARMIVFVAVGPDGALFRDYFGTSSTTLITMTLLVVVSFTMASVSAEQVARKLAAGAAFNRRELADAAYVQRRLMPDSGPDIPGYEIVGACVPSRMVSGDFFDWQQTPEGLAVTVADVMGKGVGAAMLAATVRAALRTAAPAHDPGRTLALVEAAVETDLAANEAFVTLLHLRLDITSGLVTVADAGHGLGVISRADGSRESITSGNLPLGAIGAQEWHTSSFHLHPGDLLLIFSDGVLDLFDGTFSSVDRAVEVARAAAPTASAAVDNLALLTANTALPDDVTVVAIRRAA